LEMKSNKLKLVIFSKLVNCNSHSTVHKALTFNPRHPVYFCHADPYLSGEASKTKAFTLLELLLVIAIIASLAGLIIVALNPAERLQEANEVRSLSQGNDLQKALNTYALDNNGQYPPTLQ